MISDNLVCTLIRSSFRTIWSFSSLPLCQLCVLHLHPLRQSLLAQALEDLVDAVGEVKALQERTVQADRSALIDVSVQVTSITGFPSVTNRLASCTTFFQLVLLLRGTCSP